MARLIYVMNISLDGYVSDRDGDFNWSVPTTATYDMFNELQRPVGTYLYGRRLYEMMAIWDTAHVEPGAPAFTPGLGELEREFATLWRAADKVVFSTTLERAATPRTRIEREFDPAQIRALKASSARDLTVGGPALAAAMIAADLVDDFHAVIHPIVVGGGTPWLPPDIRVPLELVRARDLGGVVHVHYRAKR